MMKISKTVLLASLCLTASTTLFVGCETPARRIEADKEGIVRADRIDIQDFTSAAAEMLKSLYQNGVLERAKNKPAVIGINRIINDTGEQFDTDLLTTRVTETLLNSGKAQVDTLWAGSGKAIDPNSPAALNDKVLLPDFTLVGKITKSTARAGDLKQATYTFMLTLSDVNTGRSVWIISRDITKQGSKPSVGL